MAHVYVDSNAAGAGTGADWANAYVTLAAALTAKAAGDNFWVAHNHAETQATAMTLTSPGTAAAPCTIICVNSAGTVPPVSADLRTTATITTTGNSAITITKFAYYEGITFNCGSGAVTAIIALGNGIMSWLYFKNCALARKGTTASSGAYSLSGATYTPCVVVFDNTTLEFGAVNDRMLSTDAFITWRGGSIAGTVQPGFLVGDSSSRASWWHFNGVDLSLLGSGKTLIDGGSNGAHKFIFEDCKLNSAVAICSTPTSIGLEIYVIRSDSAGTNYRHEKYLYNGTQIVETTIIRTGGASDGTTGLSWKITTTANAKWILPFEALRCAVWNDSTAANVSVTLEGVWNAAALPNDDEFWFDISYLGTAGNPQATFKKGSKADFLAAGAALTASTQAWDSLVTARANSTAYSVGDVRKVASNSGRVFFCTTAGTSAGSEPAGYASAVDGGSVTDNTAVFRAGVRFKKTLTLSSPQPAQKGSIYIHPKAGKASSTFWIDPDPVLS